MQFEEPYSVVVKFEEQYSVAVEFQDPYTLVALLGEMCSAERIEGLAVKVVVDPNTYNWSMY